MRAIAIRSKEAMFITVSLIVNFKHYPVIIRKILSCLNQD